MGLSNFDRAAERVLLVLVMSTVLSVALFENMLRYVICASSDGCNWEFKFRGGPRWVSDPQENARERRISSINYPVQVSVRRQ
ncbi:hypothetical protein SLEP1_g25447 [Rubroshorea leprosula]|uniref:Secreted protein n=1 Tax=Rubroshorea leprosula TaxID=152421 RepID=A0AAV5JR53_9ROSI|nr:hypothetical protein SLEP1_g25447 [Rubroshorea leprosula]